MGRAIQYAQRNGCGSSVLFEIENGLREIIIKEMHQTYGQKWIKQKVAADIKQSMKDGQEYENNLHWFETSIYHPIYYANFPDLKKIIVQTDNWKHCFQKLFGNKDEFEVHFSSLENIRNRIAHSRLISEPDLVALKKFHREVENCFNQPVSIVLSEAFKSYSETDTQISDMINKLKTSIDEISSGNICSEVSEISDYYQSWWCCETYILGNMDDLLEAMMIITTYSEQPRGWGSAHKIEKWIQENNAILKISNAVKILQGVVKNERQP